MTWLLASIVLSVVLTLVLNVGLRLFPGAGRRITSATTEREWAAPDTNRTSQRRVRVWAPWKAMIVGSLLLTIVVNLVLTIA